MSTKVVYRTESIEVEIPVGDGMRTMRLVNYGHGWDAYITLGTPADHRSNTPDDAARLLKEEIIVLAEALSKVQF